MSHGKSLLPRSDTHQATRPFLQKCSIQTVCERDGHRTAPRAIKVLQEKSTISHAYEEHHIAYRYGRHLHNTTGSQASYRNHHHNKVLSLTMAALHLKRGTKVASLLEEQTPMLGSLATSRIRLGIEKNLLWNHQGQSVPEVTACSGNSI